MTAAANEADALARARSQLWTIPAALPRAEWVRTLMAARSAGIGENEARDWSASAPDSFDEKNFGATWRSITTDAGIGPGTLAYIAKSFGWQPARLSNPPPVRAAWARKSAPGKREPIRDADTATMLAALWDRHEAARTADPQHPYLLKKRVLPHFARQDGDDLLIGMFDSASAEFVGLQTITPDGEKRFSRGTRAAGAFHLVEWPEPLDARDPSCEQQPVLFAEGWANAATLAECLPWCWCVSTFSAGNLPAVALALARQYPHRRMLVCADDDRDANGLPRNGNPGRLAALEAAAALEAVTGSPAAANYLLPVFPRACASGDFNEMRAATSAADVRDLVCAALQVAE
ncbi:hypothetical protein F6X40_28680 [Paraburkholderia sp. UCT31]|uniref:PriCT-2 domain-containing protein n=1 Tax=Paraburkholderia sp. UCT31 TaxID=2615209 RepID=UPI001654CEB6|nr:PriCT-2 domain-containing protein [Paraburkholderia sp. UCT31]MBC8740610.1 hypothetical protein [Paraburkholderia sp. UCT31]